METRAFRRLMAAALLAPCGGCSSAGLVALEENREMSPSGNGGGACSAIVSFSGGGEEAEGKTLFYDTATGEIRGGGPGRAGEGVARTVKRGMERSRIGGRLRISGQVTREKHGNAALRSIVGLGAGGSSLETRTMVFNEDKSRDKPWLVIWTRGGGGREPGAIFSAVPSPTGTFLLPATIAGAALGAANGAAGGTGRDAWRTGRTIVRTIEWAARGRGGHGAPKIAGVAAAGIRGVGFSLPVNRTGKLLSLPASEFLGDPPDARR